MTYLAQVSVEKQSLGRAVRELKEKQKPNVRADALYVLSFLGFASFKTFQTRMFLRPSRLFRVSL